MNVKMDNKFENEKRINMEGCFNRLSKANNSEFVDKFDQISMSVRQVYNGEDLKIDNIGILCRNKIIELEHQFEKHDLSMFASSYNFDGEEVISKSLIGYAIELEMLEYISKATTVLQNIKNVKLGEKNAQEKSLVPQNPLSKFWAKVKKFFFRKSEVESELSNVGNTIENIRETVSEYQNICEKVEKYNLQDNLADTIENCMNKSVLDEERKREFIEGNIIPEVTKLGLESLVPRIREKNIPNNDGNSELSRESRNANEGMREHTIDIDKESRTNVEIKKDDGMER